MVSSYSFYSMLGSSRECALLCATLGSNLLLVFDFVRELDIVFLFRVSFLYLCSSY